MRARPPPRPPAPRNPAPALRPPRRPRSPAALRPDGRLPEPRPAGVRNHKGPRRPPGRVGPKLFHADRPEAKGRHPPLFLGTAGLCDAGGPGRPARIDPWRSCRPIRGRDTSVPRTPASVGGAVPKTTAAPIRPNRGFTRPNPSRSVKRPCGPGRAAHRERDVRFERRRPNRRRGASRKDLRAPAPPGPEPAPLSGQPSGAAARARAWSPASQPVRTASRRRSASRERRCTDSKRRTAMASARGSATSTTRRFPRVTPV